jgi:hypothetical protein
MADGRVVVASRIGFGTRGQSLLNQIKNPGTSTRMSKTSARRGTRRSPMIAHETSPVLGASVMGMTYGAHHRLGNMLASVLEVPTASAREDRLRPKGRLHQQPATPAAGW